jgi:predicted secreted protein
MLINKIPTEVNLAINETYILRLPGLGTAGYLWSYELIGSGDIVTVLEIAVESLQPNVEDLSRSVGSSIDQVFTIRALKTGQAVIRFVQKSPWESNQLPLKEYTLKINVRH